MTKKVFSTIFLVISFLFSAACLFAGVLCLFDIKTLSSGAYANSFDMWYALRIYPRVLLNVSFYGLLTTNAYVILSEKGAQKILKGILYIFFIAIIVAAFVLRYFCYRDF